VSKPIAGNGIEYSLRLSLPQYTRLLVLCEAFISCQSLSYLKQLYENNAPEFIYYKTLFHIFEKFIGDAGKSDADLGKTSLFETK